MRKNSAEVLKLCPEDIKFHFRHGMFLIRVINNESDGIDLLKKAQAVYNLRN